MKALQASLLTLVRSLDEPTQLPALQDPTAQLHAVAQRLSTRATALAAARSLDAATLDGGAALVQQACEDLTALWQLMNRDALPLVRAALRPRVLRALETASQLVELLVRRSASVSPGTGLVWAACDALMALVPTLRGVVVTTLQQTERLVEDTAREMGELKCDEEDGGDDLDAAEDGGDDDDADDDALSREEYAVAQAAVLAVKGARGTLRGAAVLARLETAREADLLPLLDLGRALGVAAENLGCTLYAPQDADEVRSSLIALRDAVVALCAHLESMLEDPASVERAKKMRVVALQLCADSLKPFEIE